MDNLVPFRPKPPAPTEPERITAQNYDRKALEYAQASGLSEFPIIRPGMPEWIAWERYFDRHLHWRPWIFKAAVSGQKTLMTVPTQWPEWFDLTYGQSETA